MVVPGAAGPTAARELPIGEDDRPVVPAEADPVDESAWYSRLWESARQADRS